ncbi:hypothetical protein BGZ60DRAFT_278036 [Tricladium varicosporioides]|nr:hypothetical protein BGZ60DRAFT_278036 [Hymenoscyphus varicosporioides]
MMRLHSFRLAFYITHHMEFMSIIQRASMCCVAWLLALNFVSFVLSFFCFQRVSKLA